MKKIVLSLAGVMVAAAFAPEASALPLFARQTGMACSACHFQHFPMLNSFGRSFKSAAYTMVGAQGKVEGDRLSIPDTLNAAVLTTMGYVKVNGPATPAALTAQGINTTTDGTIFVPGTNGEFSLFVGGRTSDFSGALAELGMLKDPNTAAGAGVASAKFPMLWQVGDAYHVGVVPFTTDGQGASYGFETMNTGANAVHTMLFAAGDVNGSIGQTVSAQQYIGTNTAATGAAIVANSDMGFINVTKFHQLSGDFGFTAGAKLDSTYLRVAAIFDVQGWDTGVGLQSWSGQSANNPAALATAEAGTKATAIDAQMQGALPNGMPLGVYFSYANAPTSTSAGGNVYNPNNVTAKKAMVLAAELGVVPEVTTVGFAYRKGNDGAASGANGDNSVLLSLGYKLQQNMLAQLVYTKQSGSAWNGLTNAGDKQTAITLSTIF